MSFTDGKPWVVTKEDCGLSWGGGKLGKYFRCYLCGHRFRFGDTARWQFTNDVPGAGGNPLVCIQCDGTKEEIIEKMKAMREKAKEMKTRLWWVLGQIVQEPYYTTERP